MQTQLAKVVAVACLVVAGCGGGPAGAPTARPGAGSPSGGTPAPVATPGVVVQPTLPGGPAFGGVRIHLVIGGGPEAGTYDLTHDNPCHYNRGQTGGWFFTGTFPTATSGPSIVDLQLIEGNSFIEPWFGNESYRAKDDVTFTVDDRGETATLTAQGTAAADGGASFPIEIAVECDRIGRF